MSSNPRCARLFYTEIVTQIQRLPLNQITITGARVSSLTCKDASRFVPDESLALTMQSLTAPLSEFDTHTHTPDRVDNEINNNNNNNKHSLRSNTKAYGGKTH
jgi:hypothetical protein